jgi:large subunit ribosomal protein L29
MASKLPKSADLRDQDEQHLAETLRDTIKSQFDLRFRNASERGTTVGENKKLRRQIARIKTNQRQREIEKAK